MILKSKVRYWTLFWPKYCAAAGGGVTPAASTANHKILRIALILSTLGLPRRPPAHPPRAAPADRTPAAPDGRRAPRNPRNPIAPTVPAPGPRRGAVGRPVGRGQSPGVPPCLARACPTSRTR